ncbi:MAG: methyltransferase domain-containing protein [Bdellovibrionales bacterium]|nr:methyltransferase domain-containing protein [Bdellovibrionales bacterium]
MLCQSEAVGLFAKYKDKLFGQNLIREYFSCNCCDLVFLHPEHRLSYRDEKLRYLEHENAVSDLKYMNYLKQLWDFVEESLGEVFSPGLDYGCGPAKGYERLLEGRCQIDSFDPYFYPHTIMKADSYQFILCSEAAEHFYSPFEQFQEMQKLLRPKGFLGLRTELRNPSIDFEKWYYRLDPTHVVFYSEKTLLWLAQELDLEIIKCSKNLLVAQKT